LYFITFLWSPKVVLLKIKLTNHFTRNGTSYGKLFFHWIINRLAASQAFTFYRIIPCAIFCDLFVWYFPWSAPFLGKSLRKPIERFRTVLICDISWRDFVIKIKYEKEMMMEIDKRPSECIWGQNIDPSSRASSMTWRRSSWRWFWSSYYTFLIQTSSLEVLEAYEILLEGPAISFVANKQSSLHQCDCRFQFLLECSNLSLWAAACNISSLRDRFHQLHF